MNGDLSDHYCMGCPWGRYEGDRFFCPFVTGSCARLRGTVEEPIAELADSHLMRLECARRKAGAMREEKERAAEAEKDALQAAIDERMDEA